MPDMRDLLRGLGDVPTMTATATMPAPRSPDWERNAAMFSKNNLSELTDPRLKQDYDSWQQKNPGGKREDFGKYAEGQAGLAQDYNKVLGMIDGRTPWDLKLFFTVAQELGANTDDMGSVRDAIMVRLGRK